MLYYIGIDLNVKETVIVEQFSHQNCFDVCKEAIQHFIYNVHACGNFTGTSKDQYPLVSNSIIKYQKKAVERAIRQRFTREHKQMMFTVAGNGVAGVQKRKYDGLLCKTVASKINNNLQGQNNGGKIDHC